VQIAHFAAGGGPVLESARGAQSDRGDRDGHRVAFFDETAYDPRNGAPVNETTSSPRTSARLAMSADSGAIPPGAPATPVVPLTSDVASSGSPSVTPSGCPMGCHDAEPFHRAPAVDRAQSVDLLRLGPGPRIEERVVVADHHVARRSAGAPSARRLRAGSLARARARASSRGAGRRRRSLTGARKGIVHRAPVFVGSTRPPRARARCTWTRPPRSDTSGHSSPEPLPQAQARRHLASCRLGGGSFGGCSHKG